MTYPWPDSTNSLTSPHMALLYAVVTRTITILLICLRSRRNWAAKALCVGCKADDTEYFINIDDYNNNENNKCSLYAKCLPSNAANSKSTSKLWL